MRDDDINLIQNQKSSKKIETTLTRVAIGIFGIIFVIGALILVFSIFLSGQTSALSAQISNLRSQITTEVGKKDKMLITSERLTTIRGILSERNGVEGAASLIYATIPTSFTVDSLSADGKQILITLTGNNLGDFAVFLSKTLPGFIDKNKNLVTSVQVDSFVQSESQYTLNLKFKLTGAKVENE